MRVRLQMEYTRCGGTNKILVDIIVHAASSIFAPLAVNLIKALGKRREAGGKQTYLIHVSLPLLYKHNFTLVTS
jgi:hypothetical protein